MKSLFRIVLLVLLWQFLNGQVGDNCANPYVITLQDPVNIPCTFEQISSLDFNDYSSQTGIPNPGCSYGSTNHDIWIKTIVPSNSDGLKITIDSTVSTDNDYRNFVAAVYTGVDCGSLIYRTCKTTSRSSVYNNFFDGLTPGENVYIRIYRKNSTSGTWDKPFFVRLTAINTIASEDACAFAKPLLPSTYCNYTATDKNESDSFAPDKLTGTDNVCSPGTLPFGSFDNNQWYYFEVFPYSAQPIEIVIDHVSCTAGDQILQVSIWKTTTFNCANWTSGYNLTNAGSASDGDLVACAVGTGNVSVSKNLPPGKYWFTIDGSAGAFCQYDITTTVDPPLPLMMGGLQQKNEQIEWYSVDDNSISYYVLQGSLDGITFFPLDTLYSKRSHGFMHYQFDWVNRDVQYFRIEAHNFSGNKQYSEVLHNSAQPNILSASIQGSQLEIKTGQSHVELTVQVYSLSGIELFRINSVSDGNGLMLIPLPENLSAMLVKMNSVSHSNTQLLTNVR